MKTANPFNILLAIPMLLSVTLVSSPVLAQDVTPPPPETDKTTQKDVEKIRNSVTRIQGIGMDALGKTTQLQQYKIHGAFTLTNSASLRNITNNTGYAFTNQGGSFALNSAEINVRKEASDNEDPGFYVRIMDGEAKQRLLRGGLSLAEVYGFRSVISRTDETKYEVGQFRPLYTFDDIGVDAFVSKSFAFQYMTPVFVRGFRIQKDALNGSKTSFQVHNPLVDGSFASQQTSLAMTVDTTNEAGTRRRAAFAVTAPHSSATSAAYMVSLTNETPAAGLGLVRTQLQANASSATGTGNTTSFAAAIQLLTPQRRTGQFGIRLETLSLTPGSLTPSVIGTMMPSGRTARVGSLSLSFITPDLTKKERTVVELRYDAATQAMFATGTQRSQVVLSVGHSVLF
ncbi:MAG: hypothetical protein ACKO14_09900 [Armatimonadota bacterium]